MIYVIADDLTGATDTGVQFSKQGYNSSVVIVPDSSVAVQPEWFVTEAEVLVIDTETREADPEAARHRVHQVLANIPLNAQDIIYKKVDSTLRGNIGAELDECLKTLNTDLCIFTPSFPSNKRITVEGYVIVQDQPLGLSEYYTGNLEPEEASYIPSVLQQDTDYPIARIDIKDVMRGGQEILRKIQELVTTEQKILVADAMNGTQLEEILKGSFAFNGSVLYSGSAGLANALSALYHGTKRAQASPGQARRPVLVVSGSMSSTTQRQITHARTNTELCNIMIDLDQLLESAETYLQELVSRAGQSIQDRRHTLIYPDPLYLETLENHRILSRYRLNFRELGVTIRDFLGALTLRLMEDARSATIILTGGDIAIGVCSALGIYNLHIKDELLPGIPLSTGVFKEDIPVHIVTKAGGFGEENALTLLIDKLTKYHSVHNSPEGETA